MSNVVVGTRGTCTDFMESLRLQIESSFLSRNDLNMDFVHLSSLKDQDEQKTNQICRWGPDMGFSDDGIDF